MTSLCGCGRMQGSVGTNQGPENIPTQHGYEEKIRLGNSPKEQLPSSWPSPACLLKSGLKAR